MDNAIFSIIVQYHQQPPFETQAFRPMIAADFTSQASLGDIYKWVKEHHSGCDIEYIKMVNIG